MSAMFCFSLPMFCEERAGEAKRSGSVVYVCPVKIVAGLLDAE